MSQSSDESLRQQMPEALVIPYFKKYGCARCESKERPRYRFALCEPCYREMTERLEAIVRALEN